MAYGNPMIWYPVRVVRLHPGRTEATFHYWLWRNVASFGPAEYRINRIHVEGERRGFHSVWQGYVDETGVVTQRKYSGVKGIPGAKTFADLYFKKPSRPSPAGYEYDYL